LFQLTIDNLNKSNLIPSKDYAKNKLITGMLQVTFMEIQIVHFKIKFLLSKLAA
jgi:hypothetical protein